MPQPQAVFHALLRPAILQILRATGFHSAKPTVVDSMTDLATRYLEILCQETARCAAENMREPEYLPIQEVSLEDVRRALEDVGAFLPERDWEEQDFTGQEDTRGVDEFIAWATGAKIDQIKRVALDEPEEGVTDYLTGMWWPLPTQNVLVLLEQQTDVVMFIALKKRHSKTADDAKYMGTLLGDKWDDQGLVPVEGGGALDSIEAWNEKHRTPVKKSPEPGVEAEVESRPASSGLSSVGTIADEMDLSGT